MNASTTLNNIPTANGNVGFGGHRAENLSTNPIGYQSGDAVEYSYMLSKLNE